MEDLNIFWVARDKNGSLTLFNVKPVADSSGYWVQDEEVCKFCFMPLDDGLFPNLKYEDGPIQVRLAHDGNYDN